MTLTRTLIAPILAAAIALTPMTATPARADDDIAKALLGALVLYGIAESIDTDKRDNDRRADRGRDDRQGWQGAARSRAIPAQCVRTVETREGPRRVAVERCLRREGVHRLPDRCEMPLRGRNGGRDAYSLRCLERAGFRVEGWRR
ncbi:hypothetical protein [Rhodovulum marinum]|uniref:Uncharacterized protein n=1 Tax=Rhodovulum marinum TaxID=320662 RepID=A0A4R2PUT8_9RHOB|nr:hypothetical protein [Rhodovulum marinum]TCP39823.1 hypothetical protein EV662_110131 [Rhodovulum marinum]